MDDLAGESGYTQRLWTVRATLAAATDITFAVNPFADLSNKLCVAATARTGGNFFCQEMRAFGARPGEYFHVRRLAALLSRTGERLEDHCAAVVRRFAYQGGFAVKGSLDMLVIPYLAGEFPRGLPTWAFVHLRRRGIVKQAISRVLARRTGEWRSSNPAREAAVPVYDESAILASGRLLTGVTALWEDFFDAHRLAPLRIWYEDLVEAPEIVCAAVARFAGLSDTAVPGPGLPRLAPQSGAVNAEWEARLRSENPRAVSEVEAGWVALGIW